MKISAKDSVHRKLADDVTVTISAVRRMIADELYMIFRRNNNMIYQRLNVSSEKMRVADEKIIKDKIHKI
jgi:Trm5-related predicted tRNA methylase